MHFNARLQLLQISIFLLNEIFKKSSHSVHQLTAHIVFGTKYRCHVLKGGKQVRCRDEMKIVCDMLGVRVLKGVVSKDHAHLHIGHPPKLSIGNFMRRIKGRGSRELLQEFPDLQKRYYGRHFWGMGHGVWSSGNITQDMIGEYLEHHREKPNDDDNLMLEQYFSMNFSLHHIVNL